MAMQKKTQKPWANTNWEKNVDVGKYTAVRAL
jgi:hypothetical protein